MTDTSTTTWLKLISVDDLPDDDVIAVSAGDAEIAVYRVAGEVFATDNVCRPAVVFWSAFRLSSI